MSVEEFRQYCKKFKFYYFDSIENFYNKIDYNGNDVSDVIFEKGIVDEGINNIPTRYSAYGELK